MAARCQVSFRTRRFWCNAMQALSLTLMVFAENFSPIAGVNDGIDDFELQGSYDIEARFAICPNAFNESAVVWLAVRTLVDIEDGDKMNVVSGVPDLDDGITFTGHVSEIDGLSMKVSWQTEVPLVNRPVHFVRLPSDPGDTSVFPDENNSPQDNDTNRSPRWVVISLFTAMHSTILATKGLEVPPLSSLLTTTPRREPLEIIFDDAEDNATNRDMQAAIGLPTSSWLCNQRSDFDTASNHAAESRQVIQSPTARLLELQRKLHNDVDSLTRFRTFVNQFISLRQLDAEEAQSFRRRRAEYGHILDVLIDDIYEYEFTSQRRKSKKVSVLEIGTQNSFLGAFTLRNVHTGDACVIDAMSPTAAEPLHMTVQAVQTANGRAFADVRGDAPGFMFADADACEDWKQLVSEIPEMLNSQVIDILIINPNFSCGGDGGPDMRFLKLFYAYQDLLSEHGFIVCADCGHDAVIDPETSKAISNLHDVLVEKGGYSEIGPIANLAGARDSFLQCNAGQLMTPLFPNMSQPRRFSKANVLPTWFNPTYVWVKTAKTVNRIPTDNDRNTREDGPLNRDTEWEATLTPAKTPTNLEIHFQHVLSRRRLACFDAIGNGPALKSLNTIARDHRWINILVTAFFTVDLVADSITSIVQSCLSAGLSPRVFVSEINSPNEFANYSDIIHRNFPGMPFRHVKTSRNCFSCGFEHWTNLYGADWERDGDYVAVSDGDVLVSNGAMAEVETLLNRYSRALFVSVMESLENTQTSDNLNWHIVREDHGDHWRTLQGLLLNTFRAKDWYKMVQSFQQKEVRGRQASVQHVYTGISDWNMQVYAQLKNKVIISTKETWLYHYSVEWPFTSDGSAFADDYIEWKNRFSFTSVDADSENRNVPLHSTDLDIGQRITGLDNHDSELARDPFGVKAYEAGKPFAFHDVTTSTTVGSINLNVDANSLDDSHDTGDHCRQTLDSDAGARAHVSVNDDGKPLESLGTVPKVALVPMSGGVIVSYDGRFNDDKCPSSCLSSYGSNDRHTDASGGNTVTNDDSDSSSKFTLCSRDDFQVAIHLDNALQFVTPMGNLSGCIFLAAPGPTTTSNGWTSTGVASRSLPNHLRVTLLLQRSAVFTTVLHFPKQQVLAESCLRPRGMPSNAFTLHSAGADTVSTGRYTVDHKEIVTVSSVKYWGSMKMLGTRLYGPKYGQQTSSKNADGTINRYGAPDPGYDVVFDDTLGVRPIVDPTSVDILMVSTNSHGRAVLLYKGNMTMETRFASGLAVQSNHWFFKGRSGGPPNGDFDEIRVDAVLGDDFDPTNIVFCAIHKTSHDVLGRREYNQDEVTKLREHGVNIWGGVDVFDSIEV